MDLILLFSDVNIFTTVIIITFRDVRILYLFRFIFHIKCLRLNLSMFGTGCVEDSCCDGYAGVTKQFDIVPVYTALQVLFSLLTIFL